jgi:arylformamidase
MAGHPQGALSVIGQFDIAGRKVRVDFTQGACLAIPLYFADRQPSYYSAPPANAHPMHGEGFTGDTNQGGSCNVPVITINPHCNGTHTESISHLVHEQIPIHEILPAAPIPATLITVEPVPAASSGERFHPTWSPDDQVITSVALNAALAGAVPTRAKRQAGAWLEGLIVRTQPNDSEKPAYQYGPGRMPPFLSLEAMELVVNLGTRHLLVDIPSVDKMYDQGLLAAHRRFWNLPDSGHGLTDEARLDRTITEMIYVSDTIPDGQYLLQIQIPAFTTDAAPSRPWLFPVEFA